MLAKGQHLFAVTAEFGFRIRIAGVVDSLEHAIEIEFDSVHDAIEHQLWWTPADTAKLACDAIEKSVSEVFGRSAC